jgi:hypothetical protein
MQESPGPDPMAEAAGSSRGRHQLALAAARHGRAQWLAGVRVFKSYGALSASPLPGFIAALCYIHTICGAIYRGF